MRKIWCCDTDGINSFVAKQLTYIRISRRDPVFVADRVQPFRRAVADRDHLGQGVCIVDAHVLLAHDPEPDHAYPHFVCHAF
jgi:hypothetical protein